MGFSDFDKKASRIEPQVKWDYDWMLKHDKAMVRMKDERHRTKLEYVKKQAKKWDEDGTSRRLVNLLYSNDELATTAFNTPYNIVRFTEFGYWLRANNMLDRNKWTPEQETLFNLTWR